MNIKTNQQIGHDCGYGWEKLIKKAERIVDLYNYFHSELEFPLDFSQIKEKWGGLCLYLNQYIPEVSDKIHKIEGKSYLYCEHCGTSKNVKTRPCHGWYMTLCDDCRKKEEERYKNITKKFNI